MEKNVPTGDGRKPQQNFVKVQIQKHEGRSTVNVRGLEINAANAEDVGVFGFHNVIDRTGQGGTADPKRDYNIEGHKFTATGSKKVGVYDFDNYTLENSNDKDDAAAGGSGDQGHKRTPRSSASASNKKSPAGKK